MSMYDLVEGIKRLGADINDFISGKNVEEAIKDELHKNRILTPSFTLEPVIMLNALRAYNKIKAYGISDNDLDDIIKNYLQYGVKPAPNPTRSVE